VAIDSNQPAEATRLFAEILAVEPDWPDALDAQFWFFIAQGDHAFVYGTLDEALSHFQAAEATVQHLLKAEPDAPHWQRDLSIGYDRVGEVLRAQGDLAGALKSYRDSLAIREKLARQDPTNAGWQSDVAYAYWRTGSVWAKVEPNSKNKAQVMVEKGRDILRQLKKRMGLTANRQGWLESIEADLRKMDSGKNDRTISSKKKGIAYLRSGKRRHGVQGTAGSAD
jgi:tetratricopeptide (TPR) repeat protein